LLTLVLALAPTLASADDPEPRPTGYTVPGAAVYPEGIAYQPSTGYFFVSSTGDGTIFRGHVDDPDLEVFLPGGEDGRTFVAGLEVSGGRLFAAGGGTGMMFVYDLATKALVYSVDNNQAPTFVNDVAVDKEGNAYFTESLGSDVLYRLQPDGAGGYTLSEWLDFTGTPLVYIAGFNVNGISATPDGKYLLVVQSNTGKLFRITIATKEVVEIDLGGVALTAGDGIELRGHTLYVVRNSLETIAEVLLAGGYASGTVVAQHSYTSTLEFPTTAVIAQGRLLVVNAQFNRRPPSPLPPILPFTVTSLPLP
jgi:Cu-Zn family superoxide dismutase